MQGWRVEVWAGGGRGTMVSQVSHAIETRTGLIDGLVTAQGAPFGTALIIHLPPVSSRLLSYAKLAGDCWYGARRSPDSGAGYAATLLSRYELYFSVTVNSFRQASRYH
jgi:hypothetical protein